MQVPKRLIQIDIDRAVIGINYPVERSIIGDAKEAVAALVEQMIPQRSAWDEIWERARKAGLAVTGDFSAFWRDFEWMGVQRQLKVLGIFARLCHRDGKSAYLDDMPRVLGYLRGACKRYRALGPLGTLIDEIEGRGPLAAGIV